MKTLVIAGSRPDVAYLKALKLKPMKPKSPLKGDVCIGVVVETNSVNHLAAFLALTSSRAATLRHHCRAARLSDNPPMNLGVGPQPGFGDKYAEVYLVTVRRFKKHFRSYIFLSHVDHPLALAPCPRFSIAKKIDRSQWFS
jgi:hypothetical protein